MEIKVVGCGSSGSFKLYNNSFLLTKGNSVMLIDCGTRIPIALHDHGINIKSITDIYISHAHSDHCGGLEEIAFGRYDFLNKPRHYSDGSYAPRLIANEKLMEDLWEHTLSGGMKSTEGFDAQLSTFFQPVPIKANMPFTWEGWTCSLIQQIHVVTGSIIMNSFGLLMEKKGHKTVYFTTDTQFFQPEQVALFYKKADIIFQDCELIGVDVPSKTMRFKSNVHANYAQLAGWEGINAYRLDADTKQKLHLGHYQDYKGGNFDHFGNYVNWDELAKEDGFAGFISVGQTFEV